MKKRIMLVALGLLGSVCLTTSNGSAQTKGLHRLTSHWVNQHAKTQNNINRYYRLNQNTKSGPFKGSKVILPKGTIVSGSIINDSASKTHNAFVNGQTGLSYALKKRVGMKKPWTQLVFWQTYMLSRYPRVKKPAFMPALGEGVFYTGGVKSFTNMAKRYKSSSSALRLTSDGYVEFYQHRNQPLITTYYETFAYNQKPISYAKINHTLVKGSKTYLYYSHNLKGVNDQKVRKSGAYKYRLTIHNLHTPYRYTIHYDTAYGSMYTIGGHHFYSMPLKSENSGE